MDYVMTRKTLHNMFLLLCGIFSCIVLVIMGIRIGQKERLYQESLGKAGNIVRQDKSISPVDVIKISLPVKTTENQVYLLKNVENKSAEVILKTNTDVYYYSNPVHYSGERIESFRYDIHGKEVTIDFLFDNYYECEFRILDGELNLFLYELTDYYSLVIAVDPLFGGEETGNMAYGIKESEINLQFSRALKEQVSGNCILILLRNEDAAIAKAERMQRLTRLKPDFYITVHCMGDAKTRVSKGMTLKYKGEDTIARDVCRDIFDFMHLPENSEILENLDEEQKEVHYIDLGLGYLTNKGDGQKLDSSVYRKELAVAAARALKNSINYK